MALIKTVRGWTPKIGKNCYLAENATIVGDVEIGDDCSIWFKYDKGKETQSGEYAPGNFYPSDLFSYYALRCLTIYIKIDNT